MPNSETSPAVQVKDDGPRPLYFLGRGDGQFTPLIALDDLPEWITIEGLPRYIPGDDLHKWNALGSFTASSKSILSYTVLIKNSQEKQNHRSDSDSDSDKVPSTRALNARLSRALDLNDNKVGSDLNGNRTLVSNNRADGPRQRYNPTTPGIFGQKKYCTHWMRTGECDFTQQGCMYLHEMPDLPTMEEMGYRSYPRWFREMPRSFQSTHAKDLDTAALSYQGYGAPKSPPGAARDLTHQNAYPQNSRGFPGGAFDSFLAREKLWSTLGNEIRSDQLSFGPQGQLGSALASSSYYPPYRRVWSVGPSEDLSRTTTKQVDNDRSLFSRNSSPDPLLGLKYPKLQPVEPSAPTSTSRFDQPSVATAFASRPNHRALNDGAPPTPEQTYTKRFVNNSRALPQKHVAPDAKVNANATAGAATSAASTSKTGGALNESQHAPSAANGGGHRQRGRGGGGARFVRPSARDAKKVNPASSGEKVDGLALSPPGSGKKKGPRKLSPLNTRVNQKEESPLLNFSPIME